LRYFAPAYGPSLSGRSLFKVQGSKLIGMMGTLIRHGLLARDRVVLEDFCLDVWTAPLVSTRRRIQKRVLSEHEQSNCIRWAVDFILGQDQDSHLRFVRELGRRGAEARWGQVFDPDVLRAARFQKMFNTEIAAELRVSRRTVQEGFRKLGAFTVLSEEEGERLLAAHWEGRRRRGFNAALRARVARRLARARAAMHRRRKERAARARDRNRLLRALHVPQVFPPISPELLALLEATECRC
jgi:hypothetical protein